MLKYEIFECKHLGCGEFGEHLDYPGYISACSNFQILEIVRNPQEGAESAALTDSNSARDDEIRHQRLLQENDELKKQIAEVDHI